MHDHNPILQKMHLDAISTANPKNPRGVRPLWQPTMNRTLVGLLAVVGVGLTVAGASLA